jgi:hypothetical protein
MTQFIDLDRQILREVPQADVILIEDAVRRATRRFCAKTLVLEATTDPYINVVADQAEYTLPAVANREIVRVKRRGVWWGADYQLMHKSEDQLDLDEANPTAYLIPDGSTLSSSSVLSLKSPWRTLKDAQPVIYYQPRPDRIRVVPIPNTTYTAKLGVTYHLKPSLNATEVDDFVVGNWYETLVHGALSELLSEKQKPWSDPRRAAEFDTLFATGMDGVISDRVGGFGSNDYAVGRVKAWP